MESAERQASTLRRVRSMIELRAKRCSSLHDSPKERARKETEFFKQLFLRCDGAGAGTLRRQDIVRMARTHLKIAERLVSDEDLHEFFTAVDEDGSGEIDCTEFLAFINVKEENAALNDLILKQVKRAVRLAFHGQKMTLEELMHRFNNAAAEGIIDSVTSDGSLGPEEMRRFFRKVLGIDAHDAPDKSLVIAFRAMDEDGGGTVDAEEVMAFVRTAIAEESALCPNPNKGQPYVPGLLAGTRGALPERSPKRRPGTTRSGGIASVPFCLTGRDAEPRTRIAISRSTGCLQVPVARPSRAELMFNSGLSACGLPKLAAPSPASPASRKMGSTWRVESPTGSARSFIVKSRQMPKMPACLLEKPP